MKYKKYKIEKSEISILTAALLSIPVVIVAFGIRMAMLEYLGIDSPLVMVALGVVLFYIIAFFFKLK